MTKQIIIIISFLYGCTTAAIETKEKRATESKLIIKKKEKPKPIHWLDKLVGRDPHKLRVKDYDETLSKFTTEYKHYEGSDVNRSRNIVRIAELLQKDVAKKSDTSIPHQNLSGFGGVILNPGEEFSFNKIVGVRSEENGFFEAPIIFLGEMVPGIGGGTCQTSSTIYAAALMAGLEIIYRRPHTRKSGYINYGFDATVNYPEKCIKHKTGDCADLKFKNPYEFPIWIVISVHQPGPGPHSFIVEITAPEKQFKEIRTKWRTFGYTGFKQRVRRSNKYKYEASVNYKKRLQRGSEGIRGARYINIHMLDGTINKKRYDTEYRPVPEIWEIGLAYSLDGGMPWEE